MLVGDFLKGLQEIINRTKRPMKKNIEGQVPTIHFHRAHLMITSMKSNAMANNPHFLVGSLAQIGGLMGRFLDLLTVHIACMRECLRTDLLVRVVDQGLPTAQGQA